MFVWKLVAKVPFLSLPWFEVFGMAKIVGTFMSLLCREPFYLRCNYFYL